MEKKMKQISKEEFMKVLNRRIAVCNALSLISGHEGWQEACERQLKFKREYEEREHYIKNSKKVIFFNFEYFLMRENFLTKLLGLDNLCFRDVGFWKLGQLDILAYEAEKQYKGIYFKY